MKIIFYNLILSYRYKRDINQTIVMNFATEIIDNGYNNSQIEIDDDWETCYGELVWDLKKFPDPAKMVADLKAMGFRVTMWIHPFMNELCPSFAAAKQAGYFAKDEDGKTRTRWWNGIAAAIVDFTNPEATEWFMNKVRAVQQLTQVYCIISTKNS
jgi:myogenesis-regulating glycosidase